MKNIFSRQKTKDENTGLKKRLSQEREGKRKLISRLRTFLDAETYTKKPAKDRIIIDRHGKVARIGQNASRTLGKSEHEYRGRQYLSLFGILQTHNRKIKDYFVHSQKGNKMALGINDKYALIELIKIEYNPTISSGFIGKTPIKNIELRVTEIGERQYRKYPHLEDITGAQYREEYKALVKANRKPSEMSDTQVGREYKELNNPSQ